MERFGKTTCVALCGAAVWLGGCATVDKPMLQRAWIGGEYRNAGNAWLKTDLYGEDGGVLKVLPPSVQKEQSGAVLVTRVSPATPLALAGVQEGDLVLKIDGKTVVSEAALQKAVDALAPGQSARLTLLRKGEMIEKTVTTGKETYQEYGNLTLGFGLGTELDLWPDPDFNILSLIRYQQAKSRVALQSPETVYLKSNSDAPVDRTTWNLWLLFAGVGGSERIHSQEIVQGGQP